MKSVRKSVLVPHSVERMYALVDQFEDYPQFLPWCGGASTHERTPESVIAEIEIAYTRAVMPEGNPVAVRIIEEVFEPIDSEWRGIGVIPGTGLAIRAEYAEYDTLVRIPVTPPETRPIKGCQCGDVLRGAILPFECKLFGRGCTPEHPIGPCMVSSEGSCAAYYRYTDYGRA